MGIKNRNSYISPLQRTRRTAELLQLGFHTGQHFYDRETETVKASEVSHETPENLIQMTPWLHEWHYGEYEGLTRMEIESRRGAKDSWSIWTDGCPGGECVFFFPLDPNHINLYIYHV